MYKKLKKILSTRGHVLVRDENDSYNIVSKSINGMELLINNKWYGSRDEAFNPHAGRGILIDDSCSDNWQIIDVFDTPQERFKVGDEVVICENAKEELEKTDNWDKEMKKYIGKIGEIVNIHTERYEIEFDDGEYFYYTYNCISYPFKEEKKDGLSDKEKALLTNQLKSICIALNEEYENKRNN